MRSDERVTPITEVINRLENQMLDAEWDLDFNRADRLYEELGYYKKLLKEGELYVPNF